MSALHQEERYTNDEEFVDKVEQAIQDYLFDPDSERITTRFKARWLDVEESPKKVGSALKQLKAEDKVKVNSHTQQSKTWRYLGDPPDTEGER